MRKPKGLNKPGKVKVLKPKPVATGWRVRVKGKDVKIPVITKDGQAVAFYRNPKTRDCFVVREKETGTGKTELTIKELNEKGKEGANVGGMSFSAGNGTGAIYSIGLQRKGREVVKKYARIGLGSVLQNIAEKRFRMRAREEGKPIEAEVSNPSRDYYRPMLKGRGWKELKTPGLFVKTFRGGR